MSDVWNMRYEIRVTVIQKKPEVGVGRRGGEGGYLYCCGVEEAGSGF
jgi:hypothetical protein